MDQTAFLTTPEATASGLAQPDLIALWGDFQDDAVLVLAAYNSVKASGVTFAWVLATAQTFGVAVLKILTDLHLQNVMGKSAKASPALTIIDKACPTPPGQKSLSPFILSLLALLLKLLGLSAATQALQAAAVGSGCKP